MTKELLSVRKQTKSTKPTFKGRQAHQFAKLRNRDAWRRPRGMGNKVRRQRRGQGAMPSVGYGAPRAIRGTNRDGLREVIISNIADLAKIDTKSEVVVISRTVGGRKKIDILAEVKKLKLSVSNVKNIEDTVKSLTKVKKEVAKKVAPAKKVESKKEESNGEESKK